MHHHDGYTEIHGDTSSRPGVITMAVHAVHGMTSTTLFYNEALAIRCMDTASILYPSDKLRYMSR
jgi:hypothetical protein